MKYNLSVSLKGKEKRRVAIACLLLGGIGLHHFILGEKRKGAVKIILFFIFGISCIFALFDFVRIVSDFYEPDKNAYI